MELSRHIRDISKTIAGKEQFFWQAFAKTLEVSFCLIFSFSHKIYGEIMEEPNFKIRKAKFPSIVFEALFVD